MTRFFRALVERLARFLLPVLFGYWLFWVSRLLPLSLGASILVALLVWILLALDAGRCLERFCENQEPRPTPVPEDTRPEVRLEGFLRLLALYLVTAVVMTVAFLGTASYFRSYFRPGPLTDAPTFREAVDSFSEEPSFAAAKATLVTAAFAFLSGFIAYRVARALLFPHLKTAYRRGRWVGDVEQARELLEPHREPNEPEIAWGGLGLPWSSGTRHFLAVGTTGSGKTNLLLQFMASVLIWIGRKQDQRALIYDPKTELVSFLHGLGLGDRVRILHPFDQRSSSWDLAADVDDPSAAQQVATILIPEDKKTKNPFFSRAAAQLLAGVFTFLMKQTPGNWDLRDVIFIMEREACLRDVLGRFTETASLVEEFFNPAETFANVRNEIAIWMRRYRPIASCWYHAAKNGKVSLKDWVKGDYVLLLGQDEAHRFQMEAINRALFLRASQLMLSREKSDDRRTWVICDEVREMGHLEGLSRLLTNGRAWGVSFCGGYQTPSGMKEAVGEHVADEINDQMWTIALCRMGGDVSAEWASRLVGDVEFEEEQSSEGPGGESKTTHVVTRRALMPEYFKELPLPTPETGVSGVFLSTYTGAYHHTVPAADIARVRSLRHKEVPDLVPRPASDQELPPWTEEDYRRLGLTPEPEPGGGEKPRLRVLRSASH